MEQLEKPQTDMNTSENIEGKLNDDIAEIIENSNIDEENQQKLISVIQRKIHSGPLPSPETLKQYNEIPGIVDKITNMAISEMNHRHMMEEKLISSEVRLNDGQIDYVKANIKLKQRLQIFGFVITILLIVIGALCLVFNKNMAGTVTFVGAIGGFCWTMFYGKSKSKDQTDNSSDKKEDDE